MPGSSVSRVSTTETVRWLIAAGLAAVAAIAGIVCLLVVHLRQDAIDTHLRATNELAAVLAEQTERSFQGIDLVLQETLSALTSMRAASRATSRDGLGAVMGSRAMFEFLSDRKQHSPQIDTLALIAADGHIVNSTANVPPRAISVGGVEHFEHFRTADDHGVFVTQPIKSTDTGKWTLFVTRRINDLDGTFAGVAAAGIELSTLTDFYRAVVPPEGAITLLRRDGVVLAHLPGAEEPRRRSIRPDSPWYRIVREGGGTYHSAGNLGGPSFVSVRPLARFPLVIDALTYESLALAQSRRQSVVLIFGGLLAACVAVLLMRFVTRHMLRLERSEAALAARNADLEALSKEVLDAHAQFDLAVSNIPQGICLFDRDQNLIVCNRKYAELYKLDAGAVRPGMSFREIMGLRDASGCAREVTPDEYEATMRRLTATTEPAQEIYHLRDGRTIAVQSRPIAAGGWVGTHEDITERQRVADRIVYLASHDVVTGLPNRTKLRERLDQALALTGRGMSLAVLCLDLDRFKAVNDTLGHPAGDALLIEFANRLRASTRETDVVARLGGDEFVILQVNPNLPEDAAVLAERIVRTVSEPYGISGQQVIIGVSIGIALAPEDGTSADTLLKNADMALYLAKEQGRGTYRFFESELEVRTQKRHALEQEIRRAVVERQFEVLYQPAVDIATGRIITCEALLRWTHPVHGMLSPADFIPIAEDTGLIVPLGEWVLRQACRDAVAWGDDVRVAVNISAIQIRAGGLAKAVAAALADSGLSARRLELEITETVLLDANDVVLTALREFRDLGVAIAMDDFGTGYSALSYLRRFPFDNLKIDRSFVADLADSDDAIAIVRAIIGLCRSLRIWTTAEGVETVGQLAILRDEGCDRAQGYHFSRPCRAAEAGDMIRAQPFRASRREAASGFGLERNTEAAQ